MNFIREHLLKAIDRLSQDISGTKSIIAFDDTMYNGRYKLYGLRATGLPMIKESSSGIFVGIDWSHITSNNLVNIYNILKQEKYFLI